MNCHELQTSFRELAREALPLPGSGQTCRRLSRLCAIGQEDLSLAKLLEAHWDAVAILAEAGRAPEPDAVYAVWASEIPGRGLELSSDGSSLRLDGTKPFCSGLGLVDRALVTVLKPKPLLVDIDMRMQADRTRIDLSGWQTDAFRMTNTGAISFECFSLSEDDVIGQENFYLQRPGFWQGACGPAACWVGGAARLVAYARDSKRSDAHTLAHLGAMDASLWSMKAGLQQAGAEIDASPHGDAMLLALRLRQVVEQGCTEIIRRLPRAYGPHPLAMDAEISACYRELDLYLRQSHAERDLEALGKLLSTHHRFD